MDVVWIQNSSQSDFFCASYCFNVINLTKVSGMDFESAVLNFYYRRFS